MAGGMLIPYGVGNPSVKRSLNTSTIDQYSDCLVDGEPLSLEVNRARMIAMKNVNWSQFGHKLLAVFVANFSTQKYFNILS
jgi:hypothetical protein